MATPGNTKFESRISSYSAEEFGGGEEEPTEQTRADAVLESLEEPQQEESEENPELSDVDLRLETADYYRAILKHDFFNTDTPAASIVDQEIRTFIRERLEILLGLRAPRPEAANQFSDEEVEALKVVASKILGRPSLVGEPTVRKMPTPATKANSAPPMKPKPTVRKIPAPAAAPSTKPKAKQTVAKTEAKKPEPEKPAPAVEAAPKPAAAPSQSPTAIIVKEPGLEGGIEQSYVDRNGVTHTLVEGSIIEEGGRRFKIEANGAGTLFRRDITGQLAPANRLPPMNVQQMSIYSQQMAEQQLGMLDDTTGLAVVAALRPQQ